MSEIYPLLIRETGLSEIDLRLILRTAPSRYKEFPIKKRDGSDRIIAQPARELKVLQRAFVREYLINLPIHPAATAYREGMSILDNASMQESITSAELWVTITALTARSKPSSSCRSQFPEPEQGCSPR